MLVGEFVALLTNEALPVTAPLACGANRMLTDRFAPAAMVNGKVSPVTLKPAPVVLAEKTVTLELAVFVSVAVSVAVVPTGTVPKARLGGAALSRKVGGGVAVPESPMGDRVFAALLTSARLPLKAPAACGANWMVTLPFCPGGKVNGSVVAVTLKTA